MADAARAAAAERQSERRLMAARPVGLKDLFPGADHRNALVYTLLHAKYPKLFPRKTLCLFGKQDKTVA
jgi:hypothetical protein